MGKINKIIKEVKKQQRDGKIRKTKNNELYFTILGALCEDDEYISKHVKRVENGELVTEDRNLCKEFRQIMAKIIRKVTNMTADEAYDKAKELKVPDEFLHILNDLSRETDYIAMAECNKKVQLFKKPDIDVSMTVEIAGESVRPNPRDNTKKVRIKSRKRVRTEHSLYPYQKDVIN